MAEFGANAVQTIQPQGNLVFTSFPNPLEKGIITWEETLNRIILRGVIIPEYGCNRWRSFAPTAQYYALFSGNIAVSTGGTAEEIQLAIAIDGVEIPVSIMASTPAAVEEFNSVSTSLYVPVTRGCCSNITVKNISEQAIDVRNANLTIVRPDMYISR